MTNRQLATLYSFAMPSLPALAPYLAATAALGWGVWEHGKRKQLERKIMSQKQQLDAGIQAVKAAISAEQARVKAVIDSLTAKNDATSEIDLSDDIAELAGAVTSLDNIAVPSVTVTTEDATTAQDVPTTAEMPVSDTDTPAESTPDVSTGEVTGA